MQLIYKHANHLLAPLFFFAILCAGGCVDKKAREIVDRGIEVHGGTTFESFVLEFDFRDRHYIAARNKGMFTYTREFTDSTGRITDVLNNEGFTRTRNGSVVRLSDERKEAFTRSVNSVVYFALLPYGLNDAAVNKAWVKETSINGKPYDVVRVTFDKAGGGEGYQDEFLYWFHSEKGTMDFMAYSYHSEGGGVRFREAVNPRKIKGILIQDYINYKPENESIGLDTLESMFLSGTLEKLSEIKLENVKVTEYSDTHAQQ